MKDKDYYKILGVSKNASQDEIKRAFKQLARKYHPDVNPNNKEAEEKFKEINEAFQILGNPEKREQYDNYGTSAFSEKDFSNFTNFNFDDLFGDFESIFDIFGIGKNRGNKEHEYNQDLQYDLEITLEEAFTGTKKILEIPIYEMCRKCDGLGAEEKDIKKCEKCNGTGQIRTTRKHSFASFISITACSNCNGTGRISLKKCESCNGIGRVQIIERIEIKIPKGVDDGHFLKIEGKGNINRKSDLGEIYIVIHIKRHPFIRREEEHLFIEKEIDLLTAIFGGKVDLNVFNRIITLKIPPATQSHTIFRIEGEGMPILNSHRRGNLFVKVIVRIPKLRINKEKEVRQVIERSKES
ncbi:MAG: molecular chaperone DnaJ [Candidatus Pacearchaeota archaeon]